MATITTAAATTHKGQAINTNEKAGVVAMKRRKKSTNLVKKKKEKENQN